MSDIKKIYIGGDVTSSEGLDDFLDDNKSESLSLVSSSDLSSTLSTEESLNDSTSQEEDDLLSGGGKGAGHKKKLAMTDDNDDASIAGSDCTIDLLSHDPLFLVLSSFFMSKDSGDNIATILEKINNNLEKLVLKRS